MFDFMERSVLAQILIVVAVTWAIAFLVVWFPYGFVTGDLTINPVEWEESRRAVLMLFWLVMLAVTGIAASS